jgi:hypothetical protein
MGMPSLILGAKDFAETKIQATQMKMVIGEVSQIRNPSFKSKRYVKPK